MSCRNYETILTEVARGQMMDARAKTDALAHAESCARCAARLANEHALSAGLRALGASAVAVQAPARVEAALVAAFRHGPSSVPVIAHARSSRSRRARWSVAAAAAVILVASTLAALRLLPAGASEEARRGAPGAVPQPVASPFWKEDEDLAENKGPGPAEDENEPVGKTFSAPQRNRRGARQGLPREVGFDRAPVSEDGAESAASGPEEIATDFMPLTYGGSFSQLDDGQVVRVEIPRSALHTFGLPVNAERAGGRVKADVLLGHDGVARAIRFVR